MLKTDSRMSLPWQFLACEGRRNKQTRKNSSSAFAERVQQPAARCAVPPELAEGAAPRPRPRSKHALLSPGLCAQLHLP